MLIESRRILLIGGNYFPEPTGIGKYSGEMIKWLAEQGHVCTVVTAFPYYPQWKVQEPYLKRSFWFKCERLPVDGAHSINVIRCPQYIPERPSGMTRILSEVSFLLSSYVAILFLLFAKKFEYVITVAPSFELGLLGILYKKVRGGKFLYHIQDLQIDAARDLKMIKFKGIINGFLSIEKYIIKNADFVSTISKGMIEKVRNKYNREVVFFPNWVDVELFCPLDNKAELKRLYGFRATDKVVLYAGSIGHKQGLEAILHSARKLEHLPDIKFAICGCGPYKEQLMRLKDEMNLKNIVFLPLQPCSKFNFFLNMADLHLVLQKAGAGDLVLPSKLTTILSVGGVAIVTANRNTSLHEIMTSSDMGILIEPENEEALVNAIIENTCNVTDGHLKAKGESARLYAERYLARNKILNDYFTKVMDNQECIIETGIAENLATAEEKISSAFSYYKAIRK